ncbi:GTA glutaminase A [Polychaeton citri CBS 116435]|uniref:GTA glutaminase A n=1 Tax=Polychaeton citri CBS 116435 TaxID=1314669 RepID=A0A9P4UM64_9PEZI|nr:GTA glutaminase A [Polychaeton citri CBS 116435]
MVFSSLGATGAAVAVLIAGAATAQQDSTFSPLRPPAIPLGVRSPYLSTWQQVGEDGGNGGYLAGQWPTFWNGPVTGWTGMIRVDNTSYIWMGAPTSTSNYVGQTDFEYTSTKSIFTMDVGGVVGMTLTFLSPVTPDDLLRSSLPYTYLNVETWSKDGNNHDIQVYTDITAEWISGDRTSIAQWSYGTINGTVQPESYSGQASVASTPSATAYGTKTDFHWVPGVTPHPVYTHAPGQGHRPSRPHGPPGTSNPGPHKPKPSNPSASSGSVAYHRIYRQTQLAFSEINQQAEWGYWYYATSNNKGLSHQSGADASVRDQFVNNGFLTNAEDDNYRAINDAYPTFGFSIDLGSVGSSKVGTLFQISLHQQDAVQFESGYQQVEAVPSMWTNYFPNDTQAVKFFFDDYTTGRGIASGFDSQVQSDSVAAGGQDYASITTLAVRQAFGALEFTNNPAQPWVFMKEISSDGNVNTVDMIFPFHPIAIYANAKILKYLLDPLFINQEAGNWPYQFSIHDIGSAFPNATGHNDGNDEMQPLEECGDMLIMTLAYAQRANDDAYLTQHYTILKQWNEYLVQEALIPANQISTDDFAGSAVNQTNLAIKGIIGIEAMAQIANRTGHAEDSTNFTGIAHDYVEQWQNYAIAHTADPPHTTFQYGANNTYSLLYNLYGDKELGLGLVPESVYDMQSDFYPTVFDNYGVPLDTRHLYTKVDWELFCAAVASQSTKAKFVSTIAKWLDQTVTNFPFTDLYSARTGDYPIQNGGAIVFIARPAVGGVFSLLALGSAPSSGNAIS